MPCHALLGLTTPKPSPSGSRSLGQPRCFRASGLGIGGCSERIDKAVHSFCKGLDRMGVGLDTGSQLMVKSKPHEQRRVPCPPFISLSFSLPRTCLLVLREANHQEKRTITTPPLSASGRVKLCWDCSPLVVLRLGVPRALSAFFSPSNSHACRCSLRVKLR